jgi:ATP-dependent DNA helicase RecQ
MVALARQARMKKEDVHRILVRMDAQGIVEYLEPGEGPQMFFHHVRTDSKHLIIDVDRIRRLREKHMVRTKAMIKMLTEREECRERIILKYFGEKEANRCSHCDTCSSTGSSNVNPRHVREGLIHLLSKNAPISSESLLASFSPTDKDGVIRALRELLDEQMISRTDDGLFYMV